MQRYLSTFSPALFALSALSALLLSPAVQAQTWTFKAGAIRYDAHSKTDGIQGIGIPPGADAEVGDATTAVLVIERHLTPNLSAEFVLGVPTRIRSKATGSVAFLGSDILSAVNVAPTVLLTYTFGEPGQALRPYVGIGVNYTTFRSIRSSLAPKVEMSDSTGLAAHAGLGYAIDKRWGLFASVGRVDVKTKLVATASTVLTSNIDLRPLTYSAGLTYRY
jgi:outer membrane protein